jgi:hypothetical protein
MSDVPVDKLVKTYIRIRDKRSELKKTYDEDDAKLEDQLKKIKAALLDYCRTENLESLRTSEGLIYRTVKSTYWTSDWESLSKFIVEHNATALLEKRIHQTNMKQFLEEHPDLLPPGLNVDSEYSVTVRRK